MQWWGLVGWAVDSYADLRGRLVIIMHVCAAFLWGALTRTLGCRLGWGSVVLSSVGLAPL